MRLRRGHVLLIAGGAMIAISFAVLAANLISGIQSGDKFNLEPGKPLVLRTQINGTEGAYFVSPTAPTDIRLIATVLGPSNNTVIANRYLDQAPEFTQFPALTKGNYTLILSNPSRNSSLEVAANFGSPQEVINKRVDSETSVAYGFIFVGGVAAVAVGGIVLILDRRRISKMKQFGDTSDLV